MINERTYQEYCKILEEELVPAMGCTEPIALAYAAAKAKEIFGRMPERVVVWCSGNIIKNVRCVTIPNSGYMVGIEAGVTLGMTGGDASRQMEVLAGVTAADIEAAKELLANNFCRVELLDSSSALHIRLELYGGEDEVMLEIRHAHTNITRIERNGEILFEKEGDEARTGTKAERSLLNVEDIKEFADTVKLEDIKKLIDRQIVCNMAISEEGMTGKYGLGIGKVISEAYAPVIGTKMKAATAAASEARMGGCEMPVIINSGSGNQGIASSIPVIVYAKEYNLSDETLYRALVFSNLLTIFQKEFIGKLSAFCGAVSASCSSGAALTYMAGGTMEQIRMTIENTLADIPGIICDGAKVSCAAKIASSLDAALMSHHLAMRGKAYKAHTGILKAETGKTISTVGHIGKEGMRQTDKEILKVMLER